MLNKQDINAFCKSSGGDIWKHNYVKNNELQIIKLFEDTVVTVKCLKQEACCRGKGALAN